MLIDLSGSLILTLNQLAYLNHSDYHDYTAALIRGTQTIQQHDPGLFRELENHHCTRNDPMTANYLGADQFNSMLEPAVPKFFGQLGQP